MAVPIHGRVALVRNIALIVGVLVVLVMLTSHGALKGDVCASSVACVGAHGGALTLKAAP